MSRDLTFEKGTIHAKESLVEKAFAREDDCRRYFFFFVAFESSGRFEIMICP